MFKKEGKILGLVLFERGLILYQMLLDRDYMKLVTTLT